MDSSHLPLGRGGRQVAEGLGRRWRALKLESRRIKMTVEYDGTDFAGFQVQGKGERTVQSASYSRQLSRFRRDR